MFLNNTGHTSQSLRSHGMGGVISPCSLNTDGIIGRSTLHTNLNLFSLSFVYCVKKTTPNSQEVYHERTNIEQNSATTNSASYTMKLSNTTLNKSDSFSMIALHKLNPLANTFIWGCDDDTDLHKKGSMVNTNAIGQNDELLIITFMAFMNVFFYSVSNVDILT